MQKIIQLSITLIFTFIIISFTSSVYAQAKPMNNVENLESVLVHIATGMNLTAMMKPSVLRDKRIKSSKYSSVGMLGRPLRKIMIFISTMRI